MCKIILIETSAALCSAALCEDGVITAVRESTESRQQASMTAPFVQEVLSERGLRVADCDAVCVSKGPGSYTGLRVGVSTAKGLCFGAELPLIAVGTLEVLAWQALEAGILPEGCRTVVPLLDARRMEVYCVRFEISKEGVPVMAGEVAPVIVDKDSFTDVLESGPVLFVGDAAPKCAEVISHPNAHFVQCNPLAPAMMRPALAAWHEKRFEDIAYFEPFYLKEFITTVPRKRLF